MAEGGFYNEDPWLDHQIDHDGTDEDYDDDDDEEGVNKTQPDQPQPAQPKTASWPFDENDTNMTTFPKEHSGLPDTSYVEAPKFEDLIHENDKEKRIKDACK